VKSAVGFHLIHSIDSQRLAEAVDAHARTTDKPQPVLIQVNVVGEESKGGFSPGELAAAAPALAAMRGIDVRGVMTMAPLDASEAVLRRVFAGAREARETLRAHGCAHAGELSMGMSGDYEIAAEEGATMLRLGTILFGERA
jgi:pyridoxal phosphate enzyme (YggS family)